MNQDLGSVLNSSLQPDYRWNRIKWTIRKILQTYICERMFKLADLKKVFKKNESLKKLQLPAEARKKNSTPK